MYVVIANSIYTLIRRLPYTHNIEKKADGNYDETFEITNYGSVTSLTANR